MSDIEINTTCNHRAGWPWRAIGCQQPAVWRFRFRDLSPDQPLSGDYCERHARFWFSSPRYLSAVPIP